MFKNNKGAVAPKSLNESNDCTVRSLANSSGKSYEECHSIMKSLGRVDGQMMNCRMAAAGMMRGGGRLFITESFKDNRLQKGNYVVFLEQHCFSMKDGEIFDTIKPDFSKKLIGVFEF